MAGTTYSKFFWADWRADPGVQLCSLAARGLWIEMLTLMADTPDASVQVNGTPATITQIAELCRSRGQDVTPLLEELETNGVFSRDRDGTIFGRRMRKDLLKLRRNSDAGKKSAEVRRGKVTSIPTGSKGIIQPSHPTTINHQPESINHQPQKPPPKIEETITKVGRLGNALGIDPRTARNGHRFIEDLVRLETEGFDFELDILATITERRAAGQVPADLGGLAYFRKAFEAKRTGRQVAAAMDADRKAASAAVAAATGPAEWAAAFDRFLLDGFWPPKLGPSPLREACAAPPAQLQGAKRTWNEQGQHPRKSFRDRWADWKPEICEAVPAVEPFFGDNVVALPRRSA